MNRLSTIFCVLAALCVWNGDGQGLSTAVWASPNTGVFQGLTQHIGAQIGKDKLEFSIADTCTVWFYQHMKEKPEAKVDTVAFLPVEEPDMSTECNMRFPEGLEQARQAFGHTQQLLSLSLTFFQMALVGDGDDNQEYNAYELQDVMDSFGLPFQVGQPARLYMINLTSLFDKIRREVQFQHLMSAMQTLMNKGYRFTEADQTALNKELN